LLARSGLDSHLRLGVHPSPGEVGAHAWVVSDDVVVGDEDEIGRFAVLPFDP
jgi:hypothetical protein